MFDDTVVKNNDNPANYSNTNKLLWTSNKSSNIKSLGKENQGLFLFNDTVKNSIKYMYLNNNSLLDINALQDFPEIIELQLQCNLSLSDIDALSGHTKLNVLTLHNCNVNSIGKYEEDAEVYSGGLFGCTSLSRLSLQNNSGLNSLIGIESSKNLIYLVANDCALTDISSLEGHSKVLYLNLARNVDLVNVKYIQHCKALQYIYLDNNTKMLSSELDIALNGSDENYGDSILIKQCVNGYQNIPSIYWGLFQGTATVLDYSESTLGKLLTADSIEWRKLKGRTDVTKLKLNGQVNLPMEDTIINGVQEYGINTVLSSLTGMKALSLCNCSQIDSIDFTRDMESLYELDIRSVKSSLTDLSILDDSTSLNRLIVDNPLIDATGIQNLINRFDRANTSKDNTWNSTNGWGCSGYVAANDNFPNFDNCQVLTRFAGGNMSFSSSTSYRTLDLSKTNIKYFFYSGNANRNLILPSDCTDLNVDTFANVNLDLGENYSGKIYGNHINQTSVDSLASQQIFDSTITVSVASDIFIPEKFADMFNEITLNCNSDSDKVKIDFSNFNKCGILKKLDITNKGGILGAEKIGCMTNLKKLRLENVNINNIAWISSLVDLNYIRLSNNNITDISSLGSLENIGKNSEDYTIDSDDCFYLNKNNISDITPLAEAIGEDGVINYTTLNISNNSLDGYSNGNNIETLLRLHKAGLRKVIITGNYFTTNEINSLRDGMTINGVLYEGFGSGNVVN